MADDIQRPAPRFDARLAEGVAYFEKMLEIMPEERTTLEFLVVAYGQMGETDKERRTLVALTNLLIKENDLAALEGLLPRLEACDYEPAKILALKVSRLTAPAPDLTPESPRTMTAVEKAALATRRAVDAENDLLRLLTEAGIVSEALAATVRDQLEAIPADGRLFLVSALQILEKENLGAFESALEHLADRFGAPPVPLAAFDTAKDLIHRFPEPLVRQRGVVPFAKLGRFILAATLNPADDVARAEAEAVAPCRFFLADATAVEAALDKAFGETGGV